MTTTATRWVVNPIRSSMDASDQDANGGKVIAVFYGPDAPDNLRFVAAAVNACEGTSVEWLENYANPEMLEMFGPGRSIDKAMQHQLTECYKVALQRDEMAVRVDSLEQKQRELLNALLMFKRADNDDQLIAAMDNANLILLDEEVSL